MDKKPKRAQNIVLKNINISEIVHKYDLGDKYRNERTKPNTTKLSDIVKTQRDTPISSANFVKTTVNFDKKIYNCFWCRHSFDTEPMGCPTSYEPNVASIEYVSEINKDTYSIDERVTKLNPSDNVTVKDFYHTDGIFCSLNCTKAFILDNRHNRLYDESEILMNQMVRDLTKRTDNIIISPSPSWKLLIEYGGCMTIEEFRKAYIKTDYMYIGRVEMYPASQTYERKIKFS